MSPELLQLAETLATIRVLVNLATGQIERLAQSDGEFSLAVSRVLTEMAAKAQKNREAMT